jgi:outer membrane protein assembly factor BamA
MGGADDLRAFPLRSIGPGGYHTTERYGYINHTGDIKLEANIEWRFPLAGQLNGALFADAGNVWLLRNDNDRPEGKLQWSTLGKATALGTGFGLRYNLRLLLLRFDIGIPIHIPYSTDKHGYYNVPNFIRGLCFHLGVGYPF